MGLEIQRKVAEVGKAWWLTHDGFEWRKLICVPASRLAEREESSDFDGFPNPQKINDNYDCDDDDGDDDGSS